MGKIKELPKLSARLLTSSQIITSVYCVVKELLENSLDGNAKNVEVKLDDYGLEKIEVKDNGCGIDKNDIPFVARSHFTSKIVSYSDLETVHTYGFRGEALGACCAVADLVITTKAFEDEIGSTINYNHNGEVVSVRQCSCSQGSTVSVLNLFKNIPVRKQYYRSEKNKKEELRKVEELLIAYACVAHDVRFALYHNKNLIWQKPALPSRKNALIHVLGNSVVDHLKYSEYTDEQNKRKIEFFLPLPEAPLSCGLNSTSRCIIAVNNRPVRIKSFDKLIKEYYNKSIQNSGKARYPICFISFTVPLKEVDVNVEPNKTNVMLHHSDEILNQFSKMLEAFYNVSTTNITMNNETVSPVENGSSNMEPRKDESDFLNALKTKCDEKFHQTKLLYLEENPVTAKKRFSDDIVSSNSTQKRQNPVVKKDLTKEPCKKKLKTSFNTSKDDIESHVTSLKKFFSQDKTNDNALSLSTVPTVTVERITSVQNALGSVAQKPGGDTDLNKTSSFVVNTNICTDNNNLVTSDTIMNQKTQFFHSPFSIGTSTEDGVKRPIVDKGEAWSRGVDPSGGLFQPVKVLQPKNSVIPETSVKDSRAVVIESKKEEEQNDLSFERKLTAFDIFCRNNRLEIAAQNPEFNNQQIAQILHEKWSNLSNEEKAVYKNMLDKDYKQNVKKKERLGKLVSQSLSQTQSKSSNKTCSEMKPKLKEKIISLHRESIKEYCANKNSETLPSDELSIINYLAPGIWVCSKKGKLHILNTFRLQETIIYHRLLETFQFEPEPLEKPLYVTANNVGNESMDILMKLSQLELIGSENIEDQRLTANGFDIKVSKGTENDVIVELVGMAKNIAFYGIQDLKEVLLLINSKGCSASLSECRPGKIMLYLQGEANRMSRHSPPCQRIQDVEDLLSQSSVLNRYKECIHHKPFFSELWSL